MRRMRQRGLTLVELIVAFTILTMLTTMAIPLARYKVQRQREQDLREGLRELRVAIDKYKDLCDAKMIGGMQKVDAYCYPENLEVLVQGVQLTGTVDKKVRLLRRIPKDPFTNAFEWGLRSMQDDPKSTSWGGQNVFDVYTKTTQKAKDGTPYTEW